MHYVEKGNIKYIIERRYIEFLNLVVHVLFDIRLKIKICQINISHVLNRIYRIRYIYRGYFPSK